MSLNKHILTYLFSIAFLIAALPTANAQIDTMNVIVNTSFQPTVAEGLKINIPSTTQDSTIKIKPFYYSIYSRSIQTQYIVDPIKPATMVGEPLTKLYRSLLKGGMGNYTTPYGELFFNGLRSKNISYGVHAKHISSAATIKEYGFAGYSDNEINLYGKKFIDDYTLSGEINYLRNVVNHYGYLKDSLNMTISDKRFAEQRYNYVDAKTKLESHFQGSSKTNYNVSLNYYNLQDLFKTAENNFKVLSTVKPKINKEQLVVNAMVDYYNHKNSIDTVNNTIIVLEPFFKAQGDKWDAGLGVNLAIDIRDSTKFYPLPVAEAHYHLIRDVLIPYLGVTRKLEKNSYKSLSDANPFISPLATLLNTNYKYTTYVGFMGNLSSKTSFNIRGNYSQVDNMALFVTDYSNPMQNRFIVAYDDVKWLNVHGEAAYQKNEKLRIILQGDFNNYNTTKEKQAWHKPLYEVTVSTHYNLRDKITVKGDVFVIGKQYAKSASIAKPVLTLKEIIDINLGVEYRYTKRLSAFANIYNMAGTRYFKYNRYPTYRFQFMLGASYSF